jgi:hypothetical protein
VHFSSGFLRWFFVTPEMSIVDVFADAAKLKENSGPGLRQNNLIKAPLSI